MEILKRTIQGSPYLGVFSVVSKDIGLFPVSATKKDLRGIKETLGIEALQTTVANSSLLGVFVCAYGKKLLLPGSVEEREIKVLEDFGLKVRVVPDLSALGNIFALNKNAGLASNWLNKKTLKDVEKFFKIKFHQNIVNSTDLPGAFMVATDKGFIVNPNINDAEFKKIKKTLKVHGVATTANYGDAFVGSSVVANPKAAVVGLLTTGHELIRIDEGLRGE